MGSPTKKKLMIVGHARSGKDTVAEVLRDYAGYNFTSSSMAACKLFIFSALKDKYGYESIEQCFADRINHRAEWYDLISAYSMDDPTRLSAYIFKDNEIYVGCRNPKEMLAAKEAGLFDYAIWVDAGGRVEPESKSSNQITEEMCDYSLANHSSKMKLLHNIYVMWYYLGL